MGVSRKARGFGHAIRKELESRGYRLTLVHHEVSEIAGQPCVRSLAELPEHVEGVILVTRPEVTLSLVREAQACGVRRIWMQQGAESLDAIRYCEDNGIAVVHGECILMFARLRGFPHRLHAWLRGLFGAMPK